MNVSVGFYYLHREVFFQVSYQFRTMEPFVQIPSQNWPELRDLYKQWWPHGVAGFCILDTLFRRQAQAHRASFRVFCPWGDMKSGAVVLSTIGGIQQIMILPTTSDVEKLETSLRDTKLIDWDQTACFPFCDTDAMSLVNRLCSEVKVKINTVIPSIRIFRSCATPFYDIDECPPGTYTQPVKIENIPQVDDAWPHHHSTSNEFFKQLIEDNASHALYAAEDDNLLAWVFINEMGFLAHLYTDPKHRGKGYAEFLMKHVSNKEAGEGRHVWAHILEDNHASLNLFRKLEYEVIGRGVWIMTSRERIQ